MPVRTQVLRKWACGGGPERARAAATGGVAVTRSRSKSRRWSVELPARLAYYQHKQTYFGNSLVEGSLLDIVRLYS